MRRLVLVFLTAVVAITCCSTSFAQMPMMQRRPGKIFIIRGIFTVFSLGLDKLGHRLRSMGYDVEVTDPTVSYTGLQRIREHCRRNRNPGPIVIIGHSIGGRLCLHYARSLQADNIPVKLVVIADANPHIAVPANVERCVNLYVTNSFGVFHGRPVQRESRATQLVNQDMTKLRKPRGMGGVNHFNIDASDWIHRIVCNEVARATAPHAHPSNRQLVKRSTKQSVAQRKPAPPRQPQPPARLKLPSAKRVAVQRKPNSMKPDLTVAKQHSPAKPSEQQSTIADQSKPSPVEPDRAVAKQSPEKPTEKQAPIDVLRKPASDKSDPGVAKQQSPEKKSEKRSPSDVQNEPSPVESDPAVTKQKTLKNSSANQSSYYVQDPFTGDVVWVGPAKRKR